MPGSPNAKSSACYHPVGVYDEPIDTNTLMKIRTLLEKLRLFFREDLWKPLPPANTPKGVLYRTLRFGHMVVNGVQEDQLRLHAASLTYHTLIALIPLLAMSLAILKGLNFDVRLETFLTDFFAEYPVELKDFLERILEQIRNADFNKIGGIGAAVLLLVMVQVLHRIEVTFNHIWGVEESRGFLKNASNYISVIVVVPILLVIAITINATFGLSERVFVGLGSTWLLPFFLTWGALAFLYYAMPNTKVEIRAALVSGFVGALIWSLWLKAYIAIQPGVNRYNVIYGTLAVFPIFLIWLFVNWSIILIGAKITYAVQNSKGYRPEHQRREASPRSRYQVALAVSIHCSRALRGEVPRFEIDRFARERGWQRAPLSRVAGLLESKGLIAEVEGEKGAYVLTRDPSLIRLGDLFDLVLDDGEHVALSRDLPLDIDRETTLADMIGDECDGTGKAPSHPGIESDPEPRE